MNNYKIKYFLKPTSEITINIKSEKDLEDLTVAYDKAINGYTTIVEPIKGKKSTIIKTSEIQCVEITKGDK